MIESSNSGFSISKNLKNPLACLIICYSRPEGLSRILNSLVEQGVGQIYISIDGPRNNKDISNQIEIERIIKRFEVTYSRKILLKKNSNNLGAATAIVTAIDWFFKYEEMGAILEDDLAISTELLGFLSTALIDFEGDENVWLISANNFLIQDEENPERIFSHYPLIWGWATWRNKWNVMRESIISPSLRLEFPFPSKEFQFWWTGTIKAVLRKVDAWDILLAFKMYTDRRITVLPEVNLVTNIGNDSVATNTFVQEFPLDFPISKINGRLSRNTHVNDDKADEVDIFLEKNVYKIKSRHKFLVLREVVSGRYHQALNALPERKIRFNLD